MEGFVDRIKQHPGPVQVARRVQVNVPGKFYPSLMHHTCMRTALAQCESYALYLRTHSTHTLSVVCTVLAPTDCCHVQYITMDPDHLSGEFSS